jgi:hypothetical protein
MKTVRLAMALLSAVCMVLIPAAESRASTYVWIVMSEPSSQPVSGSTFTTELKVSSWNGAPGALDLVLHYDPAVVSMVDFSTPPDSEFYPNCYAYPRPQRPDQTGIACFQVTDWEYQESPMVFGILTWQVVGAAGSATEVTIEPTTVVASDWSQVEVVTYGQHIVVGP